MLQRLFPSWFPSVIQKLMPSLHAPWPPGETVPIGIRLVAFQGDKRLFCALVRYLDARPSKAA